MVSFHVTIEQDEDGWFVADCLALPGCVSQGKTEQEALDNIKEAIVAWLAVQDDKAVMLNAKQQDHDVPMVAVGIS